MRRASVIYSSESLSDHLYFVDSGYIKIVRKGADGKEALLNIVAPGELFGESALVDGSRSPSWAEVLQDGVIYEIPRNALLAFCQRHPEAWELICRLVVNRLKAAEQKIDMLCLHDVETRILYYLGSLTPVFGIAVDDREPYSLPLSQSELANVVGATRETTSTTLNSLARRGVLKLGRRMLTVTSQEVLRNAMQNRLTASSEF